MGKKHNGSLSTVKPAIQELVALTTKAFKSGDRNTILNRASTILGQDFSSPTSLSKAVKDIDPVEVSKIRQLRNALTTFAFTPKAQDSAPSIGPTIEEMLGKGKEPDVDALLLHLRMEQMADEELLGDDDELRKHDTLFNEQDLRY